MHADAFETVRAGNPLRQNAACRRVVFHDGNGNLHGLYFSPGALGKIVVSFHDRPPVKINVATQSA
jgi:hypothetical protein